MPTVPVQVELDRADAAWFRELARAKDQSLPETLAAILSDIAADDQASEPGLYRHMLTAGET